MASKILYVVVVLILLLSGCGKGGENGQNSIGNTGMPGSGAESGYNQSIAMKDLKNAVVNILGENYWPDREIDAATLEEVYGVKKDMYEEYLAETLMVDVNEDTLIIIKAKKNQEDMVKDALEAYREKNISEMEQYPQNLGKAQASRIETFQNYVCFVQLGADTTAANDVSEEAVLEQCLEENERALDAIEKALLK